MKYDKMKRQDVRKYFWEELDAYPLGNHRWSKDWETLVDASIERAIIRSQNKRIQRIKTEKVFKEIRQKQFHRIFVLPKTHQSHER